MILRRLFLWVFSILVVLVLGITGFIYYTLASNKGFSSKYFTEYVTAKITEEIQNHLPNATISLGDTKIFLNIQQFAIGVQLEDVEIVVPNTLSASLNTLQTAIGINDLIRLEIVIDNMHLQDGTVTYTKTKNDAPQNTQIELNTVPSTETDINTHMDANKKIANIVSTVGYQMTTQLRKLINTTAENVTISYKDKDMWAKIQLDTLDFNNKKNTQYLSYVADIDTHFVENPFNFGTVQGTMESIFSPEKIDIKMTTKGITRDFISGIDMSYNKTDATITGDFYNQINDTKLVTFVRSFVPFVKANTSLAVNGQTDGYNFQSGGVLHVDYKADSYYGNASLTNINNKWHIMAQINNLNDDLIQHYSKGFMQKSTLDWMRDNMNATYNVSLDLIFDKQQQKFTRTISNTELVDAKVVYKPGLPAANVPQAWVRMDTRVTNIKANMATITFEGKNITLNNIVMQGKNYILTSEMGVTGDMDVLTNLMFNATTGIKNPYAFATIKQGVFSGVVQTKYDAKKRQTTDFSITGKIPNLTTGYTQNLQDKIFTGTTDITDIHLVSITPHETIIRAKSAKMIANDTPIAMDDITLNIKKNILWYGANVQGDMSKLATPMLSHNITMQQGTFDGTIKLKYYMDKKRLDTYNIKGDVTDGIFVAPYTSQGIKTPYTITTQVMNVQLSDTSMILKGDVHIENIGQADINFTKHTSAIHIKMNGMVDKVFFDNSVPKQYIQVQKNIPLTLSYTGTDFDNGTLSIETNLQNMDLEFPLLKWKKDPSAEASLISNVIIRPNNAYTISVQANIKGNQPFYLKSTLNWDAQGLETIDITDIRFKGERFNLSGKRRNTKMYWQVNADTLTRETIQALLDSHKDNIQQESFDIDVQFNITNFIGYNGVAISPVTGHIIRKKDTITLFESHMTLSDKKENNRLYIYYTPEKYRMEVEDIGMFYNSISTIKIFGDGGRIVMDAEANKDGVLEGKIQAQDVLIVNTSDAVRMLKLFSVVGVFSALESKNIKLTKIKGTFRLNQGYFESDNISGLGNIGISSKGYVDFKNKDIDINGMILPTYQISSITGKIPVIGQILNGVNGQGFRSQYYTVKGTFDDHDIDINPISLFTFGILRDFFSLLFGVENVPLKIE